MRTYLYLFFNLLLPLSALFISISIIYFKFDYTFTQAIKLGVLSGVVISVPLSLFLAFVLLIMRLGKKQIIPSNKHKNTRASHKNDQTLSAIKEQNNIELKTILLMDKELAFDVVLAAIEEREIGLLKQNSLKEGSIKVVDNTLLIEIDIDSLTRHTSEVTIHSNMQTPKTTDILIYLKEKENSFLIY